MRKFNNLINVKDLILQISKFMLDLDGTNKFYIFYGNY